MIKGSTFAQQVLRFNNNLSCESLNLPTTFKLINPFREEQRELVQEITKRFYEKYYSDIRPRRLILGSSPARRGSAITGVPFEDAQYLEQETGIKLNGVYVNRASSNFLFEVIKRYGGRKKFYANFYMNFVCPLGIVASNSKGGEVNCNYYESKELQKALTPFIIDAIHQQISFGIDTSVCFCIGSGKNYIFLSQINKQYHFFENIIPLEHPRFITQYNAKHKDVFLEKYLLSLCSG